MGVPLRRSNVDTDQIIPAVFLKRVTKSGFDDALFYAWRRDPNFVLNKPEYAGKGQILVAGPEFGIGSSREHAVWALHDYGFRVVIAPSFADIFYGNTAKNGVLAAIMPQESVELLWKLLEEEPGREMTVSLETRTVTCGDVTLPFEVNDYVRWRLMNGYDDIDLTLQHEDDIAAYEKMRAEKFPFKPKTIPAKHWAEERIESAREPEDADWTGPLAGSRHYFSPRSACRAATAARPALSLAEGESIIAGPRPLALCLIEIIGSLAFASDKGLTGSRQ